MSVKGIEAVLSRAMNDPGFVDSLLANADEVLAGFELSPHEVELFKGMSHNAFDAYVKASPEERRSMTDIAWGRI